MEEKNIKDAIADALLVNAVVLEVDVRPVNMLHKLAQKHKWLPSKKRYSIQPLSLGSMVRISKLLIGIDVNVFKSGNILESTYKTLANHSEQIATIIAIAVTNTKKEPSKELVSFIMHSFTSKEMMAAMSIVLKQMDVTSFISSIISMKGLNLMEMSQVTEEIIASGD